MIVKLIKEVKKEDIPDNGYGYYAYSCEPDKYYFVYAVLTVEGENPSYMINVWGENTNNTIYDIPAQYFNVVDDSIPQDWVFGKYEFGTNVHSFPEMANDQYFYGKLLDDDPVAVETFERYQSEYEKAVKDFAANSNEKS